MSKQTKQNTPEIYVGLVQDPANLNRCIMEDLEFRHSIFDSRAQLEKLESYEALIKPTISKVWSNFNEFTEKVNEQTTLAYHDNFFKANPPKKQQLIMTQLMVWHYMATHAKNNLTQTTPKDPVSGRKSTISTSEYSLGEIESGTADIKTYQALKSLELFRECLEKQGIDKNGRKVVTEAILKQYVIDHAAVLKTRQEPWRIFQYYRPQLIKAKLLRRS